MDEERAAHPELAWFLDALFAAMDFQAFYGLMSVKAEQALKLRGK